MRSGWLSCCASLLLYGLSVFAGHAAEPQRVLLLHSFGPHFAPWSTISPQLREELRKRASRPVDLYETSLDSARSAEPADDRPLVDYLRTLFAQRPPKRRNAVCRVRARSASVRASSARVLRRAGLGRG